MRIIQPMIGTLNTSALDSHFIQRVPTIIVFFLAQRYFMQGVVFSGVGGMSRASLRDVAHWTETFLFDEFYAQWTPLVHVA